MKIAMIGQKRVPSREGGIEVAVSELVPRMTSRGEQVDCYNRWEPSVQKDMPRVGNYRGARLLRVRTFPHFAFNALIYSVSASIRAIFHGYDMIHLHAEGPAAMTLLLKLFRIPVVVTIHGLDWQRAKWGTFAASYLKFGERMAAGMADEVIVLTQSARDYFLNTYQRKTILIPNGIDVHEPRSPRIIRERFGLEKESYVLFLGRVVPEKGIHYLLEAFRGIQTNKRLVIAGGLTPETEYIARIREMAARDERVILTGFVQGEILEELMSNAGVYVLPSDVEGLSISLLEAMSYGRRCLVSDIPENLAAGADFIYSFSNGDVQSLRDALAGLIDRPADAEESRRIIEYVKERYDWERITESTLEVYRSVIRARSAHDFNKNLGKKGKKWVEEAKKEGGE